MLEEKKKIIVIGVGNLLLGDDGVGIHAVNELKKESFTSLCKLIDGGTAGIDLLYWLADAGYAIIADCMDAGAAPGTIFRLPAEELDLNSSGQMISIHDINLIEVLCIAKMLGKLPPTVIYGVQPENISFNASLSPAVQKSLPRLVQLIKQEINRALSNNSLKDP